MIQQQKRKHPKRITRDETLAQPFNWVAMAQTHILSANILFQKYESRSKLGPPSGRHYFDASYNVIYMLYGMAIENLVKGFIIAKGYIEPFVDAKKPSTHTGEFKDETDIDTLIGRLTGDVKREFNPILRTHDLFCLFKIADLKRKPNSDDKELLELLTDIIESGKYPIALDAKIRQHAFPYLAKHSPDDMHQHIMEILGQLKDEMGKYLVANKQRIGSSTLIDLDLV